MKPKSIAAAGLAAFALAFALASPRWPPSRCGLSLRFRPREGSYPL